LSLFFAVHDDFVKRRIGEYLPTALEAGAATLLLRRINVRGDRRERTPSANSFERRE
jgi:hypothetical protein